MMMHLEGGILNRLFETLENWNEYLKTSGLDLEGPSPRNLRTVFMPVASAKSKPLPPFSLCLIEAERARIQAEAGSQPLRT